MRIVDIFNKNDFWLQTWQIQAKIGIVFWNLNGDWSGDLSDFSLFFSVETSEMEEI